MKHIVVWSGGCDSTLILLDLIKKGVDVEVLVFETNFFGVNKAIYEENARFNILKEINKKIVVNKVKLDLEDYHNWGYINGNNGPYLFQQPFMIAFSSIFGPTDSILYFGYHKGDDFFSASYDLLTGSNYFLKILGNKNLKFSFPLRYMTKESIIRKLDSNGMLELCHWCEYPTNATDNSGRCNSCVPCMLYNDTRKLIELHNRNNYDLPIAELYYEYANEFSFNSKEGVLLEPEPLSLSIPLDAKVEVKGEFIPELKDEWKDEWKVKDNQNILTKGCTFY